MQPLDPDAETLVSEWIEKADADLEVARRIAAQAVDNLRIREIIGFHCQQAAEKYLKALLTRRQTEFPKTHDIKTLLELVSGPVADSPGCCEVVNSVWRSVRRARVHDEL